jgi:glycosyltransferase involved in cell wall biosynthesis
MLYFSLVIPVFNRPDEVRELLESLSLQSAGNFEVVIVEDGSMVKCDQIVEEYKTKMDIKYYYKDNSGPGPTRNFGAERATGDYVVFLDSDCLIPPEYIKTVLEFLSTNYIDAYGGPDRAHPSFTNMQKAINYSMTSFLTTGGIRGGKAKLDKFYPRSFNMGYSKAVFEKTRGFSSMRFGEDIDMSMRILKAGFKTTLIPEAYVYHKRRTDFKKFFKQVFNSGIARINLYKRHPEALKVVHLLPTSFLFGSVLLLLLTVFWKCWCILFLVFYALMLLLDSTIKEKSIKVGLLSVPAGFIQLTGYGSGVLWSFWKRIILRKPEFGAFTRNFYK